MIHTKPYIFAALILSQLVLSAVWASVQAGLGPARQGLPKTPYSLEDVFIESVDSAGRSYHSLSFKVVDHFLFRRISPHTRNYPAHFDTPKQKKTVAFELKSILYALHLSIEAQGTTAEILWRLGYAYGLARNLDWPGSADKAVTAFEKLLSHNPEHPRGNYYYGMFLAVKPERDKSGISYLEKSVELGIDDGLYAIGLIYLSQNNSKDALIYLHEYLKKYPGHAGTAQAISVIEKYQRDHENNP